MPVSAAWQDQSDNDKGGTEPDAHGCSTEIHRLSESPGGTESPTAAQVSSKPSKMRRLFFYNVGNVAALFTRKKRGSDMIECGEDMFYSYVDGSLHQKVFGPPDGAGQDWLLRRQKRSVVFMRVFVYACHLLLLAVQSAGVLGMGDHDPFLARDEMVLKDDTYGPYKDEYHLIVGFMCALGVVQLLLNLKLYSLERDLLCVNDPIWKSVPLHHTPVASALIADCCLALLGEPPGLAMVWDEAFKLNILIFARAPWVAARAMRQNSWTNRQPARVAGWVARVHIGLIFQWKATAATRPRMFISSVLLSGWIILSLTMTIAESEQDMTFQDSAWMVFITMTTVGYGDLAPRSLAGKLLACLSAVFGLLVTAILINLTTQGMQLTQQQRRVLDFMTAAKQHQDIEELAACIVLYTFRIKVAEMRKGGMLKVRRLKAHLSLLCARFRESRRRFHQMVQQFHAIEPRNYSLSNKIRDMDVMIAHLFDHFFPDARALMLPSHSTEVTPRHSQLGEHAHPAGASAAATAIHHARQRSLAAIAGLSGSAPAPVAAVRRMSRPMRPNPVRPREDPLVDLSPAPSYSRQHKARRSSQGTAPVSAQGVGANVGVSPSRLKFASVQSDLLLALPGAGREHPNQVSERAPSSSMGDIGTDLTVFAATTPEFCQPSGSDSLALLRGIERTGNELSAQLRERMRRQEVFADECRREWRQLHQRQAQLQEQLQAALASLGVPTGTVAGAVTPRSARQSSSIVRISGPAEAGDVLSAE